MFTTAERSRLAAVMMLSFLVGACAGAGHSTGEYLDDAVITAKIKARLIEDKQTKGFAIKVLTDQGVVQLSGFVDKQHEKDRAGEIANAVPGVKHLSNDVIVKEAPENPEIKGSDIGNDSAASEKPAAR